MSIYEINRLLEFDLGNPKSIPMKIIVDSLFQYYGTDKYDKYYKIIRNRLIKIYIDKNNQPYIDKELATKRLKQFHNQIYKTIELRYKDKTKSMDNLADKIFKSKLNIELYSDVSMMCLPLEDKNISNSINQFKVDKLNLVILLKRMGKHKEAKELLNIEESKIYTFSSYVKEWKKNKKEEHKEINKTKLNLLLNEIEKEVKENYYDFINEIENNLNNKNELKKEKRKYVEKLVLIATSPDMDILKE